MYQSGLNPDMLVEQFSHSARQFSMPSFRLNVNGGRVTEGKEGGKKVHEGFRSYSEALYPKFKRYIGDMPDNWTKTVTAIMMENWERSTMYLDEATKSAAISNFNKDMFPLIRSILPATATEKAFTIQPMFGPTSNVFTFQPVYGTTTNRVNAGDPLFQNLDPDYGNSVIENETMATGNGATTQFTGNLSQSPITPGTVTIVVGAAVVGDDGAGNLTGDVNGGGTNTINYATGAFDVTFAVAPGSGVAIEGSYQVDNETNTDGIPEIDLQLTQSPVTARRKAIRFRLGLVANFALRDQYGLDGEAELINAVGAEIAYGIDVQNFRAVVRVALDKTADADFIFNRTTPSNITRTEHYTDFITYLIQGSTYILTQSGRVVGNWALVSDQVSNMLESIGRPRFEPITVPATRGVQHIGTLDGRWEILRIIDPSLVGLTNQTSGSFFSDFMIGHKPVDFLFAGFVWAPWIAAFETPTTILDDFNARKGMASLYAQKVISAKYYLKMRSSKV